MKIRSAIPRLLASACLLCATAVFGQTTYTWVGLGDGKTLTDTNNWSPQGLPSGASQDTALWDGQTHSNLVIQYGSTSLPSTGFGSSGIFLNLSANQTNQVQIVCPSGVSAGVGIYEINLDPGAAPFILGDTSANNLKCFGRPAGAVHPLINNSTNPAIISPSCEWQAGGGNGYTYDFSGTGNWYVTNNLMPDNGSSSPMLIQLDGPGTVFWAAGKTGVYAPNSPLGTITINAGTLVIQSSGLFTGTANQAIANNGLFVFSAPAQAQTLTGVISGAGNVVVSNGTLTVSGQSTYTGTNILAGGEETVNGAENPGSSGPLGVGTISFAGGTLGFSVNNIFDYSGRFDTSAGQQYIFDTAAQNVTFTNAAGLSSSGGTLNKVGSGVLTLAGPSSYTGLTTVSAGKLVIQGPKTGTGNITVADGSALGIVANGTQVTPATLTLGTSGSTTLEFNGVNSTTTAPVAAGTISAAGTVTININSGTLAPGHSYPLLTWTSGSAPTVTLGILNGFIGSLSTVGNTIQLNITATAYTWTGLNNGNWDTTTPNNWVQNGAPATFANGGPVLFDDSATGATNVIVGGVVQPTTVTINDSAIPYGIASSAGNDIGGSASVLKAGNGTLTLSGGANSYTGPTTISGGTLIVGALANGGAASDIGSSANTAGNLVIDGGSLQFTGAGATIDRLFTVGTGGGTIDDEASGPWVFSNTGSIGYSGNGPRTITLHGSGADANTFAPVIGDNGGPTSVNKNGAGLWIVTGNNNYSGVTTIANGTLQVGNGGSTGAIGSGAVVNNGSLDFDRTGSLTVNGAVSGSGAVTNDGTGTVILAANNSYTGGTIINAGTVQVGNGGASGALDANSSITNNGTLAFNSTGASIISGNITGTGQIIKSGAGRLKLLGTVANTGGLTIANGANLQISQGLTGIYATTNGYITNNGTLTFIRQDNNVLGVTNSIIGSGSVVKDVNNPNNGDVTFLGTNTYSGGTLIIGGAIILGDGLTPGAGSIVGNVNMTNFSAFAGNGTTSLLVFNHPSGDDITFAGNITGQGGLIQGGGDFLTLTGTNTYNGTTTITNSGVVGGVIVSNNGTLGTGPMTLEGGLIFNRAGASYTYAGAITSSDSVGYIIKEGSSTLTLSGPNTNFLGSTTVSNGTLVDLQTGGDVDLIGGTLVAGSAAGLGTLQIGGNLNLTNGTLLVNLNKSLSPSNSVVLMSNAVTTASGIVTYVGGSLKLVNVGPGLQPGDKFTIFSVPVSGGAAMPIVSTSYTFNNNLAVDGSVTVATVVQPPAPKINNITLANGTNIVITATNNAGTGGGTWTLRGTNNLAAPLSTWPVISTGSFGNDGNVAVTNTVVGGSTNRLFYILQAP